MSEQEEILSTFNSSSDELDSIPKRLSILPLRDIVIFPNMIFPILIGRNKSIKAVAHAMDNNKFMFVSLQKSYEADEPAFNDIYDFGCIVKVIQVLRLPNNMLKVLVEGIHIARIKRKLKRTDFLEAHIEVFYPADLINDKREEAHQKYISNLFEEYLKREITLPPDLFLAYQSINSFIDKIYFAVANLKCKIEKKQSLIEAISVEELYLRLSKLLREEIDIRVVESEIAQQVSQTLQKAQRKYIIQEQIRALQNELGVEDETSPEINQIKEMLDKANLPEHIKVKADEELDRLRKTPSMSPEFAVNRNYLEWLAQLPWNTLTKDNFDINHVKQVLDEDHYDLEKPKERILEFIAVLNIAGKLKRQILCFVGPPGVGKTSLAKSIARAMGRKFVRFSLGGVRDEAEIRGHRRTYIGALPGKIMQSMKKAGTINPVILLDEVDKMSMDFRGDPSSALLEVLDPEQNIAFNDHYIEVDYDLSNVMFITTANVRYDIPLPLLDRMEIIELSSYIDPEKLEIAKRHIIPKLKEEYGIDKINITMQDEAILKIIREYTRESGVRNLEREIAAIFRKLAKEIVQDYFIKNPELSNNAEVDSSIISEQKDNFLLNNPHFIESLNEKSFVIDENEVERFLKAPRFKDKKDKLDDKVGVVNGLAWTSVGGDIMPIEVTFMPGTEKLTLTGKLGDVMKESAMAALSFLRSNHEMLKMKEDFAKAKEIHIHVPEGAIPKDGPSAGITMATALYSAATGKKIRGDVAMTGEITLRGNILPIGGLKEKLLAAKRHGMKTVIIPEENVRDLQDISEDIKSGFEITAVKEFAESLKYSIVDFEITEPKIRKIKK